MKKTKKYVWLVLVLLGIISTIVIFLISWYTEQNYVQRCFKSNQLLFEQIVDLSRKIDHEEKGHVEIKTNEDNGYEFNVYESEFFSNTELVGVNVIPYPKAN